MATTRRSFHEQVSELQRDLLRMGVLVVDTIRKAVESLEKLDDTLAQQVIAGDDVVDEMSLDIEKRCLQLMALQQPMARDLRAIGTALKIVTDLERMADHATDIGKVTVRLKGDKLIKELVDIRRMVDQVQIMTQEALQAYVNRDVDRARRMIEMDDQIDSIYASLFDELMGIMERRPETIRQATSLLQVAMHLERVGDHATNLGEWTIYMVTGQLEDLNE